MPIDKEAEESPVTDWLDSSYGTSPSIQEHKLALEAMRVRFGQQHPVECVGSLLKEEQRLQEEVVRLKALVVKQRHLLATNREDVRAETLVDIDRLLSQRRRDRQNIIIWCVNAVVLLALVFFYVYREVK
jgi:hypothetical protein